VIVRSRPTAFGLLFILRGSILPMTADMRTLFFVPVSISNLPIAVQPIFGFVRLSVRG
jgi:hypothetical protein